MHNGNEKAAITALKTAMELKRTHEVIIGTDAPAGSGVQPLGILRTVAFLASFGGVAPEIVFCMATGNTARVRKLDAGVIAPGKPADFVFMDRAQHTSGKTLLESMSLGDLPGIGMVMIDGNVSLRPLAQHAAGRAHPRSGWGILDMSGNQQTPRGFPSPLWGGVRGGGNPDGGCSAVPPSLSLPHKEGGDAGGWLAVSSGEACRR